MTQTRVRKREKSTRTSESIASIVSQLRAEFTATDIRATLVLHWADVNGITTRQLNRCQAATRLVESAESSRLDDLRPPLSRDLSKFNLKELEQGFEALTECEQRRSDGTVYTPDWVIDYLVNEAIDLLPRQNNLPTICDPACGSGGFLLRAAEIIVKRFGITYERVFTECIFGLDRQSGAIAQAQCLAELFLATRGASVTSERFNLFERDSLLEKPRSLFDSVGVERGFDVVTTNPPYVKLQNLSVEYREELARRYGEFIKGSYSLALLFLLAGHRMLAPGGQLAYITQNNLFTSLAGEPLRRYLQQHRCVRRVIDFGHEHVFPNASAYTCLVFLGTGKSASFEFARPASPPELRDATLTSISFRQLAAKKWRLAPQPHLDNLHRIETIGVPLGKLADIRVGFATLRDSVFLVREIGEECVASGPGGMSTLIEREITKGAVKIAALSQESDLAENTTRVIFPYQISNGRFVVISEDEIRHRFPKAYQHLLNCCAMLESRDKGKPNPDGWYAWGRSQSRDAPGPKLLTKTFDSRPNFMLDESNQLFCNGYSVSLPSKPVIDSCSIECIQRILNSSVMQYYAKLTSFRIAGGFQCYQKNFIESFGVPHLSARQRQKLLTLAGRDLDRSIVDFYGICQHEIEEIVGQPTGD